MPQTIRQLYLASQSPRRRQMMQWLDVSCELTAVELDETPHPGESPSNLAARLARAKALAAARALGSGWVLAADTVVDLDGVSLGKPADEAEAWDMLCALRGREHQVHTAVALAAPDGTLAVRRVTTRVHMRAYTEAEMRAYIATADPLDKAGAYAIQHRGFHPVDRIEVCYANVVGLPFGVVAKLLRDAGWDVNSDIQSICEAHFGCHCEQHDEGEPV